MRQKFFSISFLFLLFTLYIFAQPKVTRNDITIKQLGVVGTNAVRIKQNPVSENLYTLHNNGDIKKVTITNGVATFSTVYQTVNHGLTAPLGMTFGSDGTLYLVGNETTAGSKTAIGKIVKGVLNSSTCETRTWSVIATTVSYQYGVIYNHRMSGITVDSNFVYVNSGAATDHGETRDGERWAGLTDIILKLPKDSTNITLQNDREWLRANGYLMAEGIRNHFDLAFAGNGDLFGVENSGDRDDPEEMNWIREGHHYGWPWIIGGNLNPQQFSPYVRQNDSLLNPNSWAGGNINTAFYNDPTFPKPPAGVVFTGAVVNTGPDADKFRDTTKGNFGKLVDASNAGRQLTTFTAHRSPNGLVFDKDSVLVGDLKGGGFVLSLASGAAIALGDSSQDLLHVALTKVGDTMYTAKVTRIVYNFLSPLGIEIVQNIIYVVETGLWSASNTTPRRLYEITLPLDTTETPDDSTTSVAGNNSLLPKEFSLEQNYPNPFNPSTVISYQLPVNSFATLKVYDVLGREIATLVDEMNSAGNYSINFDASKFSSGVYFYHLKSGLFNSIKKMLLMR